MAILAIFMLILSKMLCINKKSCFQALRIKKKKFLVMNGLGEVRKTVKLLRNCFHNSMGENKANTYKSRARLKDLDWLRMT